MQSVPSLASGLVLLAACAGSPSEERQPQGNAAQVGELRAEAEAYRKEIGSLHLEPFGTQPLAGPLGPCLPDGTVNPWYPREQPENLTVDGSPSTGFAHRHDYTKCVPPTYWNDPMTDWCIPGPSPTYLTPVEQPDEQRCPKEAP
jgi:hypothetical protein